MDFLFVLLGSSGDVLPGITIAKELTRRGHRVTILTNRFFQADAIREGLSFLPAGEVDDYKRMTQHPDLWKPIRGTAFLLGEAGFAQMTEQMLTATQTWMAKQPGLSFGIVASSLSLAPRLLRDQKAFPLATLHLSPMVFRSVIDPPVLALGGLIPWIHQRFPRGVRALADKVLVDPLLEGQLGFLRKSLGLPKIQSWMNRWWHSPDLVIALFPEWYSSPKDVPPKTKQFPFALVGNDAPMPEDLESFLRAGTAPVVITLGSAMAQAGKVFAETAKAALALGRRVVVLTRHPEQLPTLPPEAFVAHWAPLGPLFSRAALVVHHGGIGTTAQAIAGGVPQLILPFAHDQPDNAHILKRHGLGDFHDPHRLRLGRLKAQMQAILASKEIAKACAKRAQMIQNTHGEVLAADSLEQLVEGFSA